MSEEKRIAEPGPVYGTRDLDLQNTAAAQGSQIVTVARFLQQLPV